MPGQALGTALGGGLGGFASGWTGDGEDAPSADRLARSRSDRRAVAVAARVFCQWSSAGGVGSWAHRSAVARQVAGWGVHAIASLSNRCRGGCRLARWSFARTSLALGDAASLPCDQARVRGHWT